MAGAKPTRLLLACCLGAPFIAAATALDRLLGHPIRRWTEGLPDQRLVKAIVLGLIAVYLVIFLVALVRDRSWRQPPHTRVTAAGREVWFVPWGAGWNPVSWKGWALALGSLAAMVGAVLLLDRLVGPTREPALRLLVVAPVWITLIWLWWMVQRHTAPDDPED